MNQTTVKAVVYGAMAFVAKTEKSGVFEVRLPLVVVRVKASPEWTGGKGGPAFRELFAAAREVGLGWDNLRAVGVALFGSDEPPPVLGIPNTSPVMSPVAKAPAPVVTLTAKGWTESGGRWVPPSAQATPVSPKTPAQNSRITKHVDGHWTIRAAIP